MTESSHFMDNPYLAGLRLRDRQVVIVGAGSLAQRRIPALISAQAHIRVIAPQCRASIYSLAQRYPHLEILQRPYQPGDLAQAWYAIAATDNPEVNTAVVHEAEHQRIFCIRGDAAIYGSAVTPATFHYDHLSVGVLASGDHRRSATIRNALQDALQAGLIPNRGTDHPYQGHVALIGAGPGDPDLITVRGQRLLTQADVVIADRLAPQELLAHLPAQVEIIDAAKIPYQQALAQDVINTTMITHAKAGKFVVRLKGGDPFVFARGYEEVLSCAQEGIPVMVVPGVTSATAVPALAGIPLTHRGITHEFTVVSGHLPPDHPKSLVNWNLLAQLPGTLVLLMAIQRIDQFSAVLQQGGKPAQTPVMVIEHGATESQRVFRTTLEQVSHCVTDHHICPPAIVVIGTVAAFEV